MLILIVSATPTLGYTSPMNQSQTQQQQQQQTNSVFFSAFQ